MKKRAAVIAAVALATALLLAQSPAEVPLRQFVEYRAQADYSPFSAAIFAQGQMEDAAKLPQNSEIVLYVDANRINGASGLQSGARCTAAQAAASYNQDTITMDGRFCPDINDAILDGVVYSTIAPTESVFLHKANGERCYVVNGAASEYLINPRDYYYQDYLARRISEKLDQFDLSHVFLDDLRPGWSGITAACGGAPKEYSLPVEYNAALRDLAEFVYLNVASKVYGNLARAGSHWDEFSFLDGAMCESCFTNWGNEVSSTQLLSDLSTIAKWENPLYIVPMTAANEKFYFSLSLLVAKPGDFYHFGDNSVYNVLPEYSMNIGLPVSEYSCGGNVCSRQFEHATVTVDLAARTGSISQAVPTQTPTQTSTPIQTSTPTPTKAWECFDVTGGMMCFQPR